MAIKISPDSKRLAYVGSDPEGTMNLYVTSQLSLEQPVQLTHFQEPEIKGFHWLADSKTVLLLKDKKGTAQFRLYAVDIVKKTVKDLTEAYGDVNTKVFQVHDTEPKAVVGINNRNPKFHDLYIVDAAKNTLTLLCQNDQFINFVFDDDLNLE